MSRYELVNGDDIHDDPRCYPGFDGVTCNWDGEPIRVRQCDLPVNGGWCQLRLGHRRDCNTTPIHYPTHQELNDQRLAFALAHPNAAFHHLAKARIERGQPWNKGGAHRATETELAYGIGVSTLGTRVRWQDVARTIKSGLVIG